MTKRRKDKEKGTERTRIKIESGAIRTKVLPPRGRSSIEPGIGTVQNPEPVLPALHVEVGPCLPVDADHVAENFGLDETIARASRHGGRVRICQLAVGSEHFILDGKLDFVVSRRNLAGRDEIQFIVVPSTCGTRSWGRRWRRRRIAWSTAGRGAGARAKFRSRR